MEGEFKDIINHFLKYYAFWIALGVVIIILITIAILLIVNRNKKKGKAPKITINQDDDKWLIALGGSENIIEAKAMGSRLTLKLNDDTKINQDELKNLGVQSILKMSDKVILVVEKQADALLEKISKK